MAPKTKQKQRPPGSLRLATKQARGNTYRRWQWRGHRRTDTGWATCDTELGEDLSGMRTRVLIALREIPSAPVILERYARWCFSNVKDLPAWTGKPKGTKQKAAWWLEIPRKPEDSVRLRFRNLRRDGDGHDFRAKYFRDWIAKVELGASCLWSFLSSDPVLRLAELQWQANEAKTEVDKFPQQLIDLRKARRAGDITKDEYQQREQGLMAREDRWQEAQSTLERRYDEQMAEIVESLPRTRRDELKAKVLTTVERYLSSGQQRALWHAEHWDDNNMTWC